LDLRYTRDLKIDVLWRAGEKTDGSSPFEGRVLGYLNRAYTALVSGGGELAPEVREDWLWLRNTTPGVVQLIPALAPGVGQSPDWVQAYQGSANIDFSGVIGEGAISLVGWEIKIQDNPDIYRITSHSINSSSATLDIPWGGPSGIYSYVTGKLEYDLLPTVLRVLPPMRVFQGNTRADCHLIDELARERLYTTWPLPCANGQMPTVYSRLSEQRIRFDTYAGPPPVGGWTSRYRVDYDYVIQPPPLTSPGTTEEPLVPLVWRRVLVDWACFWLLIDKADTRADAVGQAAKSGLMAMAQEHRSRLRRVAQGPSFGRIFPRSESFGCGPWRPR
jgi:hypothetical protein